MWKRSALRSRPLRGRGMPADYMIGAKNFASISAAAAGSSDASQDLPR
jgi:hypothetical protein